MPPPAPIKPVDPDRGRVVATSEPSAVRDVSLLRDVFGVHIAVGRDPAAGIR